MELFDALEDRIDALLARLKTLEAENAGLKAEIERERETKTAVTSRIDALLAKVREEIG